VEKRLDVFQISADADSVTEIWDGFVGQKLKLRKLSAGCNVLASE